uniref:Uncharacterized protein n=1 Tax=Micrurus paraensis TaxID=1970185 RepID=A0A2D4JYH7_9SAUR
MYRIAFTFRDFPSLYKRKTKQATTDSSGVLCGVVWWGRRGYLLRLNHVPRNRMKISEGKSGLFAMGKPTMRFSRGSSIESCSGWLPDALDFSAHRNPFLLFAEFENSTVDRCYM